MDVVLVGLPGSGKTEIGRRLAERHGATFVDTDVAVEGEAGRSISEIFVGEGEASFRARDRAVVAALGDPEADESIRRVIATGGGTIVDPRNRWRLYRGRAPVWLDAPTRVLMAHLGEGGSASRPLLAGGDPAAALEQLRAARLPFYAACRRVDAEGDPVIVAGRVDDAISGPAAGDMGDGATVLRVNDPAGRFVLGDGHAVAAVDEELRSAEATRAVIASEPGAWSAVGAAMAEGLRGRGWPVEEVLLPSGEDAKRLGVIETAAEDLARLGLERDEPLIAVGGGALTDAAGFVAATFARGVPWIAVPTTLVGQIDAAIGGKTAVDLAAGKNLVGAFHRPVAVIADVATLVTLPERHRRAALGEAVKTAILGEDRLFEVLEADGPAVASGAKTATESGALAEVVERCARFKLDVVGRDPEEHGERVALNLGHSLGHAIEATAGFRDLFHGEAVAYGLRAACRLGVARGTIGVEQADRAERLLDSLGLAIAPLPYPVDAVLAVLGADKKRRDRRLRWVLPSSAGRTDGGWTLDDAVPDNLLASVATTVLAGRAMEVAR